MIPAGIRPRALAGMFLAASLGVAVSAQASALSPSRFAGSYVATHVNGSRVARMELQLRADGSVSLRTGSSRYTQRPTSAGSSAPIVETGTWRIEGPRVVLHFVQTSEIGSNDAPRFEDLSFQLVGCELRMVGESRMVFDKQRCA